MIGSARFVLVVLEAPCGEGARMADCLLCAQCFVLCLEEDLAVFNLMLFCAPIMF